MIARNLIAHDVPYLSVDHTGRDTFHLLSDHHVKHLPVVEGKELLGVLSEEDIFNHKLYEPLREYDFSHLRRIAVHAGQHVFEVLRMMGEHRLTVIPVIDDENQYLGLITQNEVLRSFAEMASFAEPGGIVVLEMNRRDYSLATLARLAEEEDTKVLSAFVTSTAASETVHVTLKLNRQDIGRVIDAYERHEFEVRETYPESLFPDHLKERYDSFMTYLNV